MIKAHKKGYEIKNKILSITFFCLAAVALVFCSKSVIELSNFTGFSQSEICHPEETNLGLEAFSLAEQTICSIATSGYDRTEQGNIEVKILISAFASITFVGIGFLALKRD